MLHMPWGNWSSKEPSHCGCQKTSKSISLGLLRENWAGLKVNWSEKWTHLNHPKRDCRLELQFTKEITTNRMIQWKLVLTHSVGAQPGTCWSKPWSQSWGSSGPALDLSNANIPSSQAKDLYMLRYRAGSFTMDDVTHFHEIFWESVKVSCLFCWCHWVPRGPSAEMTPQAGCNCAGASPEGSYHRGVICEEKETLACLSGFASFPYLI